MAGFEQSSYTAREGEDSAVLLCVNVTEPDVLRREVTVNVETIPGTASTAVHYNTIVQLNSYNQDSLISINLAKYWIYSSK